MIGYSDDTRMRELLAPLSRLEPVPFRAAEPRHRRWRQSPVIVAAVVGLALALAGVAIAAGVGAFRGISAAQHGSVGREVLPPKILAIIERTNAHAAFHRRLLPDTARVLGTMPDGSKVYGLSDTSGDLCLFGEIGGSCGPPLSHSQPITFGTFNPVLSAAGTFYAGGVAIDGVTSVSFKVWNHAVTVPVKHNVWLYKRSHSSAGGARCIVAHFADGSTVVPFPEVPCPS